MANSTAKEKDMRVSVSYLTILTGKAAVNQLYIVHLCIFHDDGGVVPDMTCCCC